MNLKLLAAAIAVPLTIAGGLIYNFGTPQATDPVSPTGSLPAASAVVAADAQTAVPADGPQATEPAPQAAPAEAPQTAATSDAKATNTPVAPDPNVPLAIEIPGCVCHSDDPAQVESHKAYRMNQCASCHAGRTPTGRE